MPAVTWREHSVSHHRVSTRLLCLGEAPGRCVPCTSASHLPLQGPDPLCNRDLPLQGPDSLWVRELAWQKWAFLGDPHGEEKGDLGRGGKGWNIVEPKPEPALGMCITWRLAFPPMLQHLCMQA